jgi:hypothetical protein
VGFGPLAFNPHQISPFVNSGYQHAHNQVLQGLVEGGLLGGILMGLLLLAMLAVGWRHRGDWLIPGLVVSVLLQSVTEAFLSPEVFGFYYATLPAFLVVALLVTADAPPPEAEGEPEAEADVGDNTVVFEGNRTGTW